MALTIRMRQQGANSRQRFRLVVTDSRNPRDGKYLEMVGWYNPFGADDKNYLIDIPRVQYWLDKGAQISDCSIFIFGQYLDNNRHPTGTISFIGI